MYKRLTALGVLSYAAYTVTAQLETKRRISQRSLEDDVSKKYAEMTVFGRYVNPFEEYRHQTLFEFAFRRVSELFHKTPELFITPKFHPNFTPNFSRDKTLVTWLGQSCALCQLPENLVILTDPMFSEFVVSDKVGPQRVSGVPCSIDELPKLNACLISHDHQDHMDLNAINKLVDLKTTFVVPKGVKKHFPKHADVVEMGWWDKIAMPNVDPQLKYELCCTPSMHWSGRKLIDSNLTLWCSFLILRNGKPILFHGGDSGYSRGMFQAIAQRYGKGCDVALVPCGAYLPRWHLHAQHMAPFESLNVMRDLGAKNMVGVHWGTFVMSEEPVLEPPRKLLELARREKLGGVVAPELGLTMVFDTPSA